MATTKRVSGRTHDRSDFLVAEDPNKVGTWHLPVMVKGKPDHTLMGAAWAALMNPNGYRGNKYEGPEKKAAVRKLKALYKAEKMEMPTMSESTKQESTKPELTEIFRSLGDYLSQVRRAFDARFRVKNDIVDMEDSPYSYLWVRDIFLDHPTLGDSLIVEHKGDCWAVAYEEMDDGFDFADEEEWQKVIHTYVYAPSSTSSTSSETDNVQELAEARSGSVVKLVEEGNGSGPLKIDIAVIEPGWGNQRDSHYYPRKMLEQSASAFEGAKMYATNHRPDEKSVRTEVSQVMECPVGFTETGAPIARVGVFDPVFAESVRNRHALGILDGLHCSILAKGSLAEGIYEENGRKGRKVAAITEVAAVDWVTQHGAGGRALRLAESEDDMPTEKKTKPEEAQAQELEEALLQESDSATEQPSEPTESTPEVATPEVAEAAAPKVVHLNEAQVASILDATHLPDASKSRMREQQWLTEYDLKTAVTAEINYIKAITGSGKPPSTPGGADVKEVSLDEVERRKDAANVKFLGMTPRVKETA